MQADVAQMGPPSSQHLARDQKSHPKSLSVKFSSWTEITLSSASEVTSLSQLCDVLRGTGKILILGLEAKFSTVDVQWDA